MAWSLHPCNDHVVGSTEAPSKVFLLFFLLPYWLKLNHLKSRLECGFSDIFSRYFCSTVAETIGVTINPASFGAKNVQKTTFEAAEMILGPWNQQTSISLSQEIFAIDMLRVLKWATLFGQLTLTSYFLASRVSKSNRPISLYLFWYRGSVEAEKQTLCNDRFRTEINDDNNDKQ